MNKRELLREKQLAEQATRRRRILVGLGLAFVCTLVGVALMVFWSGRQTESSELPSDGTARSQQAGAPVSPPNATSGGGILLAAQESAEVGTVPHLIIWVDYRCPMCGEFEKLYGQPVDDLIRQGKITAEVRAAHFLDRDDPSGPSRLAALAAATSDTIDMFDEFHLALFEHQQDGYSQALLRDELPAELGIDGDALTKYQAAFEEAEFADFVDLGHETFMNSGWTGTPTYEVAGEQLELVDPKSGNLLIEPTPEDLLSAIRLLHD